MTNHDLLKLAIPLSAAYDYLISATVVSDPEDKAYYERKLRGRLQDVADLAGYRLVPVVKEKEAA